MHGQNIGYQRVSSLDQNEARQLDGVHLDRIFTDKCSGRDSNRPQLKECREFLRAGDTLHVHSIDRLARNLQDLLTLIEELNRKSVTVRFHTENLTFTGKDDPFQKLQLQIIGAVARFERAMLRERQREGIALAKAQGKYTGRKPSLSAAQVEEMRNMTASGKNKTAIARHFRISRTTLYRLLAQSCNQESNQYA